MQLTSLSLFLLQRLLMTLIIGHSWPRFIAQFNVVNVDSDSFILILRAVSFWGIRFLGFESKLFQFFGPPARQKLQDRIK